jgi:hypothetical protein
MKSKIIVFLLLITAIVGCGNASDDKDQAQDKTPLPSSSTNYDDNGGKNSSPDVKNQEEENDNNKDKKHKEKKDKDEKDKDDND